MLAMLLVGDTLWQVVVPLVVGYLLGSIPFGLLLTKSAGLGDIRQIGSGNIGATNVLRTGHKGIAALTLLLDGLKGTVAVLAGMWLLERYGGASEVLRFGNGQEAILLLGRYVQAAGLVGGLGAFLGHVFPVWLGFKGGKGVATYIGVLVGAAWPAALLYCGVWLVTAWLSRLSSLAALIATFVVFIYLVATGGPFVAPIVGVISALLYWSHRENIRRLMAGTETRIGAKG